MGILLERLAEKRVLVSDGAWGTMLQRAGLPVGHCPEEWNESHPEAVRGIAAAYATAGSDLVLTNTFGGSGPKLAKMGQEGRVAELNARGVRLSLEGAPGAVVAASIGPTGEFLEPYGDLEEEEMEAVFREQIAACLEGGARAVCIETMSAVEEAACAVRAAKGLDASVDVSATLTFDVVPDGYRTMMGVSPARAVAALTEAGADILGSNCGNGMEQMIPLVRAFRAETEAPLLVHANAGVPELVGGETVFRQTAEAMAAHIDALLDAGADLVGGCCGTTPDHIAAMRAAVDTRLARSA
jgi:5-methyltetrahydrofolate--homocysteine methyltransferase